jgi:hypothetical protein
MVVGQKLWRIHHLNFGVAVHNESAASSQHFLAQIQNHVETRQALWSHFRGPVDYA